MFGTCRDFRKKIRKRQYVSLIIVIFYPHRSCRRRKRWRYMSFSSLAGIVRSHWKSFLPIFRIARKTRSIEKAIALQNRGKRSLLWIFLPIAVRRKRLAFVFGEENGRKRRLLYTRKASRKMLNWPICMKISYTPCRRDIRKSCRERYIFIFPMSIV